MAIATDAQPPEMERSMWPSTKQALMRADQRRQRVQPALGADLEWDNTFADGQTFEDLMKFSKIAISHQESLARLWKNKSTSAVGLLREQLDSLQQRRIESERKKKEILDEHAAERFYSFTNGDEEMLDPVNIGEGFLCNSEPASSCSSVQLDSASSVGEDDENNSTDYWRLKAKALDNLLSESLNREESLYVQLRHSIAGLPSRLSNELRAQFKRFDNFLRLTLRTAPVVFGYQDNELRYRFVHNAFPTLTEEEVIGKTDEEICQGMGVAELMEFKRQVIRTKVPDKQEIKFNTNMFGLKTFMFAAEPVLDINDVCVGLTYLAMDVTLQVAKREKLASVQEEEAVQRAMESELNKTINITEETMRAKQMLTTMSHEIRSPLSGVISMASILARTPLNEDQKLKVEFMIKSGNDVLELINDILDLSKVEAGAMTFEAKKFRPREVVKHVVQMASASVAAQNKTIQVDSDVSEDVPLEVVGDVLRIRQVLTNLVSNSVKFTHKGKVSIVVRIAPPPFKFRDHMKPKQTSALQSVERSALPVPMTAPTSLEAPHILDKNGLENTSELVKDLMWIEFQIVDTGIGISESAIPTLFKRYSQASTTHARKYGGTGLGLYICKQLVELMGGSINVLSKEKDGSVFSFKLPLRAAVPQGSSNAISNDEDQEDADAPVMKETSLRPQTRRKVNHLSHATTEHSPVVAPSKQCCPRRLDGEDHRSNSCHGGRVRTCESHMRSQGCNNRKTERTHAAPEPVLPAAKAVKYSRPFRILVAEDDPVNVKVATQMMIALSHELKVVHNGADAVLAVQQGTYDVVLMDVHMPVMGGLEATQHIRKYEKAMNQQVATGAYDMSLRRRTRIPIIAMTADALADNIEECAKHGMDDFIAKPVNLEKLEELLIQYVASLDYESM